MVRNSVDAKASQIPVVVEKKGMKKESKVKYYLKELKKSPTGLFGVSILTVIVFLGIFGGIVAPHDPMEMNLAHKLLPPLSEGHILGTDQLGRDMLSRIMVGTKVSLIIGAATVVLAGLIGTTIGIISGYFGGWIDSVIMRIVDVSLSVPFILLVLVISTVLGAGLKNIIISLVIAGWVAYARIVRGEVLALREKEFITASIATGVPRWQIIVKHIIPNLYTPIIVLSSLQAANYIIAEAGISFLGFGVQPPQPAWGNMLSEGKDFIFSAWWLITFPGIAILLTALGINLLGDWLRDVLDPEYNK